MRTEILYQPSYSITRVELDPHEQIRVEGGAMISMDPHIQVETGATGGIFRSIKRAAFGGESFFMTTYSADATGGQLILGPALPGDMAVFELRNEEYKVQSGSFVAASTSIDVDTSWGGGRTFFGGEGLFMLRCAGSGTLIVASYGAIHHV
ncbi:MAG TPA: TIGR00266 family protein, partial [Thermomicrobiales bacterium]|nr:TIGR00266 family protein [Thermomicrobiales bacterium]